MYDVVLLSLAEGQGSGGGCGDECGGCAPTTGSLWYD